MSQNKTFISFFFCFWKFPEFYAEAKLPMCNTSSPKYCISETVSLCPGISAAQDFLH